MDLQVQDDLQAGGFEPGGARLRLQRLLRLAGTRPEHRVCVAGPDGMAALLTLCRLGYEEACYLGAGVCSACSEEPCDVVLVTGRLSRERLASAAPRLKPGGVLAVAETDLQDDAMIEAALAGVGRGVGWRVHDMADGCLVAMEVLPAVSRDLARAA